ncbi:MAG: hypothetical protein B7Z53_06295 [Rhodospirillales bacterium 12-71-4]|nr:MAG: hypothetical protein B7Z53_06295 [Rhodospirillales bacterium 12-71-4]
MALDPATGLDSRIANMRNHIASAFGFMRTTGRPGRSSSVIVMLSLSGQSPFRPAYPVSCQPGSPGSLRRDIRRDRRCDTAMLRLSLGVGDRGRSIDRSDRAACSATLDRHVAVPRQARCQPPPEKPAAAQDRDLHLPPPDSPPHHAAGTGRRQGGRAARDCGTARRAPLSAA